MIIAIQPFGSVPESVLEDLAEDLRIFPAKVDVRKTAIIPEDAFDSKRAQYRSADFLNICLDMEDDRVLGVVSVDLFAEPLNFVFGQAVIGGRAGVISTTRLADQNQQLLRERVIKEAVHELGHTFGLTHCTNPSCVMFFSNSLGDTDNKGKQYCDDCLKKVPSAWKPIQK